MICRLSWMSIRISLCLSFYGNIAAGKDNIFVTACTIIVMKLSPWILPLHMKSRNGLDPWNNSAKMFLLCCIEILTTQRGRVLLLIYHNRFHFGKRSEDTYRHWTLHLEIFTKSLWILVESMLRACFSNFFSFACHVTFRCFRTIMKNINQIHWISFTYGLLRFGN